MIHMREIHLWLETWNASLVKYSWRFQIQVPEVRQEMELYFQEYITFDIRKKKHAFTILEDGLLTQLPFLESEVPHSLKPRREGFQKLCNLEQGLCDLDVFTW